MPENLEKAVEFIPKLARSRVIKSRSFEPKEWMGIRILQISDGYGEILGKGSPIETVLFNISKQMVKMGNEVTILERHYDQTVPNVEYLDGIQVVRLDRRRASSSDLFNLQNPLSLIRIILDGVSFAIKFIF